MKQQKKNITICFQCGEPTANYVYSVLLDLNLNPVYPYLRIYSCKDCFKDAMELFNKLQGEKLDELEKNLIYKGF
jgi:hypothetical protein